jgi:hypothetical protein
MKEEQDLLRDVKGTDPSKEESKIMKYIRIVLSVLFMSFLALLIVKAIIRRFGS